MILAFLILFFFKNKRNIKSIVIKNILFKSFTLRKGNIIFNHLKPKIVSKIVWTIYIVAAL